LLFEEYLKLYYEGGLVSVYCSDKEDSGFNVFVVIKKGVDKSKGIENAVWDSTNAIDVVINTEKKQLISK